MQKLIIKNRGRETAERVVYQAYCFQFQVCDQVLTDQVQGIISQLVSNFIDIAGTFNLTRPNPLKHLNGDLRALILVSSTRSELLTEPLMEALKILKNRVSSLLATVTDSTEEKDEKTDEKVGSNKASAAGNSKSEDKLKESLVMFLHTLNLLIGMCENATGSTNSEEKESKMDIIEDNKGDDDVAECEKQEQETTPSTSSEKGK
jgi:hypothetical protein